MREREVKFCDVDHDGIAHTLRAYGATRTFHGSLATAYYDFPGKMLERAMTRLRVRVRYPEHGEPQTVLGLKHRVSKDGVKLSDEHELPPMHGDQHATVEQFLRTLGMRMIRYERKTRTTYTLDDCLYDLDRLQHIAIGTRTPDARRVDPFLEIEGPSTRRLKEASRALGLRWEDAKPWSGSDLLRSYGLI